jgi:hypothetical protein
VGLAPYAVGLLTKPLGVLLAIEVANAIGTEAAVRLDDPTGLNGSASPE